METRSNPLKKRSLHPFKLILDGSQVIVHRGLVFDVVVAEPFEVTGATADLRFEEPQQKFSQGTDIYVKIENDDPGEVDSNESARVLSASLIAGSAGPAGILIGNITNGIVTQKIKSDIYVYIPGTASSA